MQGNRKLKDQADLEESVEPITEPSGNFIGLFNINYDKLVDLERCKSMAKELHVAGEEKLGTDEETFNRIFSTQDYYTLRVIYDQYVKVSLAFFFTVIPFCLCYLSVRICFHYYSQLSCCLSYIASIIVVVCSKKLGHFIEFFYYFYGMIEF